MSCVVRKPDFCLAKTKAQISFAVTAKLIIAFVFAIWIVQFLLYLYPEFQAHSLLLSLHRLVSVRPGWKSRRLVFLCRGSNGVCSLEVRLIGLPTTALHFFTCPVMSLQHQEDMSVKCMPP